MDADQPTASAIAVANGRILAVGSDAEIEPLAGPETRRIAGEGRSLLPGFVESHLHLFSGAAELDDLHLTHVHGLDALTREVRNYAAAHPDAPFLMAQHADYAVISQSERVTRHHLDAILPDRPFAMMAADHHTVWANTLALEAAGILHGRRLGPGNEIVMGDDSLALGELREFEAFASVLMLTGKGRAGLGLSTGGEPDPLPSPEEREADRAILRKGLAYAARHGITSLHNMDGNFYTLELLTEIEAEGALTVRAKVPFHFKAFMETADLDKASLMAETYRSDWISSGFVKLFYDGVLDGWTALMIDPYADKSDWRGEPLFAPERFDDLACEIDRRGLQIAVHAIGDGAVRAVLDAYERAREANGERDSRHRIEHIEVTTAADIPRFAELGVVASMQPPHPPGAMDFPVEPTASMIGRERWPWSYPWRTLKEAGALVSFSSDWPVADISVLRGIKAALTRKPWADDMPGQSFTLHEAIEAYTAKGAYAGFADDRLGSLKPGYLADFVILSSDIEAVTPHEIDTLDVAMTVCGGKVSYDAATSG
ncbi:amidohydrolase family protein [Aliihoeflea aestuarii]|uniref:amidohydrolase n=1 Tax=Aliihoeflea aestuarii TaxID=453840 RepID=UPI002094858F|nr:amidohydrolase [Aliihoeflea aestuarii]MCO6392865.1 amidohydrolase family protein [Aliihoeflea aestuarii]